MWTPMCGNCVATSFLFLKKMVMTWHVNWNIYCGHPQSPQSTWSQGLPGHSHGFNTLAWSIFALSWHMLQPLSHNSISTSSLGHQIRQQANDFIREFTRWPICNSFCKVSRNSVEINNRDTHKIPPSCSDNSSFLFVYGWMSRDPLTGHL